MAEICLGLIFVGLTMYAVLGGADFGAGLGTSPPVAPAVEAGSAASCNAR